MQKISLSALARFITLLLQEEPQLRTLFSPSKHQDPLSAAAALGTACLAFGAGLAAGPACAQAPTPPATTGEGPGPATQPPPAPGTTQPGPTQVPAAPAPSGTSGPDASAPPAAPAAPPPNYKIQYNGLIDGYIQYQANNPHGTLLQTATGGLYNGAYNARIKTPTLQLAEINVFNTPKPGGFAFKTTLIAGDIADQNHVNFNFQTGSSVGSSGEAQLKNIQQLYGSYAFAGVGGGVDVGKFYTPFGYEVTEANANYNYTRSLDYNIVPFYHAGVRAYTGSYHGLVATGYIVNALFNSATEGVHSENGKRGLIGQLNYTDPKGKYVAIGSYGYNKDRISGTGVDSKNTVGDLDLTYNITANQLVAGEYTYVQLKPEAGLAKTTINGYAAYYRQTLTPKTAFALRVSGYQQNLHTDGAKNPKPFEFTGTYEYKPGANFTTRLEYRHDTSNIEGSYLGSHDTAIGGGSKKNQDLLILAGMFTF